MNKLLLICLLCASCATSPVIHGIPNLKQVDNGIWRGGQPNAEGWQYLKSVGVTNVLKLNLISEGSDNPALTNNMHIVYLPINTYEQMISGPSKEEIMFAHKYIYTNTFVHCQHGQDRTGLIIGTYRVSIEHWKKEIAEQEMLTNGFHKELLGLWHYWKEDVK
jgi:tyrosine-protein phosphatase SIW14